MLSGFNDKAVPRNSYFLLQSDRSRGFGFIRMSTVEEATKCIEELNGVVSFPPFYPFRPWMSQMLMTTTPGTSRPSSSCRLLRHCQTPCTHTWYESLHSTLSPSLTFATGEYMGHRRSGGSSAGGGRDSYDRRDRRDSYRDDRGSDRGGDRGSSYRDSRDRDSGSGRRSDKDRDPYGRDSGRDWRDRRSPPPRDYRRRRSYSRSPPRGGSPSRRDDDRGSSRW